MIDDVVAAIRNKVRAGGVVRYDPLRSRILVLTPELSAKYKHEDDLVKILNSTPGCLGNYQKIERILQELLR